MKRTTAAAILLITLFHSGCLSTVTRETLMRKATRHSLTPYPDTTYYCGSQHAFDYFYIEPQGPTTFRRTLWLRVRERENTVRDRFEYTTDRNRWRVVVGLDRGEKESQPAPSQSKLPAITPPAGREAHQP